MKRTLFSIIAVAVTNLALAQSGYDFSYKTGQPYIPLSGGTSVNAGKIWNREHWSIPLPFSLDIGGKVTNRFNIIYNGGMPASDTTGIIHVFTPFELAKLADRGRGTDTSRSPIRYLVEGSSPARIFKLEYWNAGFEQVSSPDVVPGDSINFQVWVYETSNIIEFHYGDVRINDRRLIFEKDPGPAVTHARNMHVVTPSVLEKIYMLTGNPSAPKIDSVTDIDDIVSLDNIVYKGTVYRFAPPAASTSIGENELRQQFTVYPTRAGNSLYIRNNNRLKGQMEVCSITGQQVIGNTELGAGSNELNISQLPAALYFLQVITPEGKAVYRFIKE